jgi:hypothetical protein
MGKSTPPQPEAPDYAEANREAIYADIETLPTRRKIEKAARLGERVEYADPETGETKVADFTGFGDMELTEQEMNAALDLIPTMSQAQLDNLTEFGPQFVKQQREQLRQMAPGEFDLREQFADRLRGGERTSEELAADAAGIPEYEEFARQAPTVPGYVEGQGLVTPTVPGYMEAQAGQAPTVPGYVEARAGQAPTVPGYMEAKAGQAPTVPGYLEAQAGKAPVVPRYLEGQAGQAPVVPRYMEAQAGQAPMVPGYMEAPDDMPTAPEYEEAGDIPDLADLGLTADMRADVEEAIADRLALGEGLSGEQIRSVEQDILRGAAKRGQTLSGGTALREILGKFRAGEELGRQRRGEATGWLASGQASADVQNRLSQQNFANTMQKIGQVNQARGATFAGEQQNVANTMQRVQQINQARAAQFAGEQQNLANEMQRVQQINQARGAEFEGQQQNLENERQRIQQINQARGAGFAGEQQNLVNEMERIRQVNEARGAGFTGEQQNLSNEMLRIQQINQARGAGFTGEQQNLANEMQRIQQINQARGAGFAGEQQNLANEMMRIQQINQARGAGFAGGQQNLANEMQRIQLINQARGAGFAGQQQNFANEMQRVQQINQARGAAFAGGQQALGTQLGARQQDIGNIQSMLGLQPVAAQGGYMSGLQQGASPFTMPQIQQRGVGLNAQAGAQGAQFAGNVFGTQAGMWQTEMAQPSGLQNAVGMLSSLGSAAGGYMTGVGNMNQCHVAREVYGNENPKWVEFFVWKETKGPRWFKALYNEYSEQWAKFISNKPRIKGIIRNWMDSKIKGE